MKANFGFTLIEVLVAVIVLSTGLLGLAALQTTALRSNQIAYNRSQATQLAYDIMDRMRANAEEAKKTKDNIYTQAASSSTFPNCLTTTGCTSADMARHDIVEWATAIDTVLPGCSAKNCGTIACTCGAQACSPACGDNPLNFTVTIGWKESNTGDDSADYASFQTSFGL